MTIVLSGGCLIFWKYFFIIENQRVIFLVDASQDDDGLNKMALRPIGLLHYYCPRILYGNYVPSTAGQHHRLDLEQAVQHRNSPGRI